MLIKNFSRVDRALWAIQVFFALVAILEFTSYYFLDGDGLDLFSGCFFLFESYHFFRLKIVFNAEYVKRITDYSNSGAFSNLNRRARRTMKRHFAKLKKFNK